MFIATCTMVLFFASTPDGEPLPHAVLTKKLKQFDNEIWVVRHLNGLAALKARESEQTFRQYHKSESHKVRMTAAKGLLGLGIIEPAIIELLVANAKMKPLSDRHELILDKEYYNKTGHDYKKAAEAISKLIADEDADISFNAINDSIALGYRDPSIVEALTKIIRESKPENKVSHMRVISIIYLQEFGKAAIKATKSLETAMKFEDQFTSTSAAAALLCIDEHHEAALKMLADYLIDKNDQSKARNAALALLSCPAAMNCLGALLDEGNCYRIPNDAVGYLLRALEKSRFEHPKLKKQLQSWIQGDSLRVRMLAAGVLTRRFPGNCEESLPCFRIACADDSIPMIDHYLEALIGLDVIPPAFSQQSSQRYRELAPAISSHLAVIALRNDPNNTAVIETLRGRISPVLGPTGFMSANQAQVALAAMAAVSVKDEVLLQFRPQLLQALESEDDAVILKAAELLQRIDSRKKEKR